MRRKVGAKPGWQKGIAAERIRTLFERAGKEFENHPEKSHRYVQLARKIGMRYNVSIPREFRKSFCKKCYRYLVPGANCTVRTSSKRRAVTMTCGECGHVMRHPYRREKGGSG